jgi:hypothetical protein
MLIGAAVCPHPPILVPAVTGDGPSAEPDGAKELDRLRAACDEVVAGLLRLRPDTLVIAGGAERSADYPGTSAGCLSQFGVWSDAPDEATRAALGGGPGTPVLPLSLTIGRWLVDRAGQGPAREGGPGDAELAGPEPLAPARAPGDVRLCAIADPAPAGECLAAGARIAALAPRVALLAMGDGPARRARGVPGAPDPEAERYDAEAAAAFAAADAQALAALDPDRAAGLLASGRAAWQVLAGAAAGATGGHAAGGFRGQVAYAGAPFEVSYLVAAWHREP